MFRTFVVSHFDIQVIMYFKFVTLKQSTKHHRRICHRVRQPMCLRRLGLNVCANNFNSCHATPDTALVLTTTKQTGLRVPEHRSDLGLLEDMHSNMTSLLKDYVKNDMQPFVQDTSVQRSCNTHAKTECEWIHEGVHIHRIIMTIYVFKASVALSVNSM
jgi:hypothetical protein